MFSTEIPKYSRRTAVGVVTGAGLATLLPCNNPLFAESLEPKKPEFVITGHGFNGKPDVGFIGSMNKFLYDNDIPFKPLSLPGEMNPNYDDWTHEIYRAAKEHPGAKLLLYSLSGAPGMEAASQPDVDLHSLDTVAVRKIHPALPVDFPLNLVDFYFRANVNIPQLIANTPHGRLQTHSRNDPVIWFEGNAPVLRDQIQGQGFFLDGFGHFDGPISERTFNRIARRIIFG